LRPTEFKLVYVQQLKELLFEILLLVTLLWRAGSISGLIRSTRFLVEKTTCARRLTKVLAV